ncbi:MAG: methyltransferase domain-containing protein [Planctomycetes bacterium]|nr:methyltransferase domain-containing protein [Planctomycetota bacterium]
MHHPRRRDRQEGPKRAIEEKYRRVAEKPCGHFPYPVGRESARTLGYEEWIDRIPADVVDRFVGVGNPFRLRRPRPGERVLDLGCGRGMDAHVASLLVGAKGQVVGLDLTFAMLGRPRRNLRFVQGDIESLPFRNGSFDVVLSNGALNLVPDKDRAFDEVFRVLRRGGVLAAADLLTVATLPPEVLADMDAWSD